MHDLLLIDGSRGEGGGQILRTTLSLAVLLRQPVEIRDIRVNRAKPGLRPQHLAAVRALAQIGDAQVSGDAIGSTALRFAPRGIRGGEHRFSIGTAGSVTLLSAAILPPLLFASTPSTVVIEGGTHVPLSPVFHYMNEILLPFLRGMGADISATLDRWGWYPRGGGACTLRITPCHGLRALQIPARGELRGLDLVLGLAGLPLHIVEREENRVRTHLREYDRMIRRRFDPAASPGQGNVLFLVGSYRHSRAGFSALGRKGKPAEQVADELCRQWLEFEAGSGSIDRYLADQIVLYLALASGDSYLVTERVTRHLTTNIGIIEHFLPVRFRLDEEDGSIAVTGMAHSCAAKPPSGAPPG